MNRDVTRYPVAAIREAVASIPTPFFLYEERRLRANCRRLKRAFKKHFPGFTPLYAVKANPNPHVLKIIQEEGFGFDCSSPAEAHLADRLGGWGMYTGNYTPREEFAALLASGRLLINIDDASMVETLAALGMPEFLSLRINPGITRGGMKSLLLAGPDAKFGVPWEKAAEVYAAAKEAGARRFGVHMMTGSNVLEERYFGRVTAKLLRVARAVKKRTGVDMEYVNLGGGFGVPYRPTQRSLDLERLAALVRAAFDRAGFTRCREPKLMIEPGRYVAADAGWLVTRVRVIKDGYKKFVGVDAGTNDLPRPAIYGAYHHISILNKNGSRGRERVNVVGRLCENNDQFARDRLLPAAEVGDILIIHNAGAHCFAMGHNYNGRPRAAEYLLWADGTIKQIRRAETTADLLRTVTGWPEVFEGDNV